MRRVEGLAGVMLTRLMWMALPALAVMLLVWTGFEIILSQGSVSRYEKAWQDSLDQRMAQEMDWLFASVRTMEETLEDDFLARRQARVKRVLDVLDALEIHDGQGALTDLREAVNLVSRESGLPLMVLDTTGALYLDQSSAETSAWNPRGHEVWHKDALQPILRRYQEAAGLPADGFACSFHWGNAPGSQTPVLVDGWFVLEPQTGLLVGCLWDRSQVEDYVTRRLVGLMSEYPGNDGSHFFLYGMEGKIWWDPRYPLLVGTSLLKASDPRFIQMAGEYIQSARQWPEGKILRIEVDSGLGSEVGERILIRQVPGRTLLAGLRIPARESSPFLGRNQDIQQGLVQGRILVFIGIILSFAGLLMIFMRFLASDISTQTKILGEWLDSAFLHDAPLDEKALWIPEFQQIGAMTRDMVRKEKVAIAQRLERDFRYRSLFTATGEAIVIHNLDGHILEMNQPARSLLEELGSPDVRLATGLLETFPGELREGLGAMLAAMAQGGFARQEYQIRTGHGLWHLEMVSYLIDRNHDLAQTFIRDNSAIIEKRQQVDQLRHQLQRQGEVAVQPDENPGQVPRDMIIKEKFENLASLLAALGHEMDTPLSIGKSLAGVFAERSREVRSNLERGVLSRRDLLEFLEILDASVEILQDNMDRARQLMHTTKDVAVDQATTVLRTFGLREHLERIMASMNFRLKRTRHHVDIDCPVDIQIHGDPGALYQVIVNLVNNSLIHGFETNDEGQITMVARQQSDASVVLEYRDDGKGIPPQIAPRVFERFFTTRRSSGGSGIGLSVVRTMVETGLQGKVWLEPTDKGVCFVMEFPAPPQAG